jgi:hypothetical protein
MRSLSKPLNKIRYKYFGIQLGRTEDKVNIYLAVNRHVIKYTTLPEYIRRFETKIDAKKCLTMECEKIVDLRLHR